MTTVTHILQETISRPMDPNPSFELMTADCHRDCATQVTLSDLVNSDEIQLIEEDVVASKVQKTVRTGKLASSWYVTPCQVVDLNR